MNNAVIEKIQIYRKKLLDLTGKNRMLNFKLSKTQGAEFVADDLPGLLSELVLVGDNDPQFEVYASEKPISNEADENRDEEWVKPIEQLSFQTQYFQAELNKRLSVTYRQHREALDDRGVNILGLATGFLKVPVQAINKISNTDSWYLPLLLVRLAAERKKDKAGRVHFVFKTEDEIIVNPAAIRFLSEEATPSVSLPELILDGYPEGAADEEVNAFRYTAVKAWLDEVSELIPAAGGWSLDVRRVVVSSSFTFHKFPMYEDLDPQKWPELADNSLIEQLLGALLQNEGADDQSEPKELEAHPNLFTVLDADSTQLAAVLEADTGKNLVVHGPPGTGKSQTITNIIAQHVAKGKKVLFVAEKRAALDAVSKNLTKAGLGGACIDLHDRQLEAKQFRDKIQKTWLEGKTFAKDYNDDFDANLASLSKNREKLSRYVAAANDSDNKAGISFRVAVGRVTSLEEGTPEYVKNITFKGIETWDDSDYQDRLEFLASITPVLQRLGMLNTSPFYKYWKDLSASPISRSHFEAALQKAIQLAEQLGSVYGNSSLLCSLAAVRLVLSKASSIELQVLRQLDVADPRWRSNNKEISDLIEDLQALQALKREAEKLFKSEAFDEDLTGLRNALSFTGSSWLKRLGGPYRVELARLNRLYQPVSKQPKNHTDRIIALDQIISYQRKLSNFEKNQKLNGELFKHYWQGVNTDVALVERCITQNNLLQEVSDGLGSNNLESLFALEAMLPYLSQHLQLIEAAMESLNSFISIFIEEGEEREKIMQQYTLQSFSSLREELLACLAHSFEIDDLILLKFKEKQAKEYSINELFSRAIVDEHVSATLVSSFSYIWFRFYTEATMRANPILGEYFGPELDQLRSSFIVNDKKFLKDNSKRIITRHLLGVRSLVASVKFNRSAAFIQQLLQLTRFQKTRRPRSVLQNHLEIMQDLFPVFMMSPLAVAQYLPKQHSFDAVIFDEASQILPEDALGTIARGKQLIVVGDQKQLPPSSFFSFSSSASEEEVSEEEELMESVESLLDLALACGNFREANLLWHYRSEHDSLIRLSSKEFYNDGLIFAPSPEKPDGRGLYYEKSEGRYQAGGGSGGSNPLEAALVARRVHEFYKSGVNESLGVISFSKTQEQVIWNELNKIAQEDHGFNEFLNAKSDEPFFVKNLENVQGDERDVTFISICYGKDDNGKIYQRFGPVNQVGGERRLNVMMTRAKKMCVVYANFSGDELLVTEGSSRGVVVLREFLRYAEHGELSIEMPQGGFDSPFEESVAEVIKRLGYQYQSQLGVMGFRIDLAIRHPEKPGAFILAVECDGATYHSAKAARDRDRLREQLLVNRGWNVYRIWSTDWRRDRAGEVKRLERAIRAALEKQSQGTSVPISTRGTTRRTGEERDRQMDDYQEDLGEKGKRP